MLNIKLDSQLLSLYNSEKREKKSFSFIFNSQLFLGNIYMRERERERERERDYQRCYMLLEPKIFDHFR